MGNRFQEIIYGLDIDFDRVALSDGISMVLSRPEIDMSTFTRNTFWIAHDFDHESVEETLYPQGMSDFELVSSDSNTNLLVVHLKVYCFVIYLSSS